MMIPMHRSRETLASVASAGQSQTRQRRGPTLVHLAVLLALSVPNALAELPNFVVIFADDLGYGDLGVYGSETIRTPNLDRMAAEGMRFTDFYTAAPFCSPSRAALLTGRYPVRAGVPYVLFPTELTGLPPAEITIAEILSDKGYATAAIGKWHLGWPKPFRAQRHGFDFFYGLPYSNDMLKWEPDTVLRPQHAFWRLPLLDNDEILEAPVNQHTLTRRYTERAVEFIEANRARPFLLYLPHTFPHNPQYASEDFEGRSPHGLYADTVEEMDWSVGEVLRTLRELGLDEKTLVVFTSDNGPTRGGGRWGKRSAGGSAGGLRGNKGTTFEGGMREPGIFWWPGKVAAKTQTSEPASILDLLPTLAELAGADTPSDRVIDGRSIADLLLGKTEGLSQEPFFYYFGMQLQAVRLGNWKLFLRHSEPHEQSASLWYLQNPELYERHHRLREEAELYDLNADKAESRNLASERPEIVERLDGIARRFDKRMQSDKRHPVYLDGQ